MEQKYLSDDAFEQIKDFNHEYLTEEQKLLIDKLILNKELKECYKSYGLCWECKQPNTRGGWCNPCNAKRFQQNFKNWTSGNDDIDKFIQNTQLSAKENCKVLEWIPYDRFYNIEYIAKGGFGKITFHHKLIGGSIIRFYGITQDPDTKNYTMVLDYAKNGSLRNHLDKSYNELSWHIKIFYLRDIAYGVNEIHKIGLIHRDLHIGNILHNNISTYITDMGLCKPADYNALENTKKNVYGVLPYIAPEILRGQNYTKAADIYSFGIIMYETISGLPPYHDVSHDENLALKICQGLRPRFNIKVPQLIVHLTKRCLDTDPLNRPLASEVKDILYQWYFIFYFQTELQRQIKEADKINNKLQTNVPSANLSYETHSEAIYTKNLQIDISQLKINNNDQNNESEIREKF
ncbi:kinase-like domain-containing protein [Glomus cerebriforme]|uniref:Kinase-like domain-containing protein n=1 Tax=Glomus cerebriforme TaxID=658196 RepID=A0A397SAP1_9GLOM|nr:kinase-like domain-containing protein [Glomus cerebriforme]